MSCRDRMSFAKSAAVSPKQMALRHLEWQRTHSSCLHKNAERRNCTLAVIDQFGSPGRCYRNCVPNTNGKLFPWCILRSVKTNGSASSTSGLTEAASCSCLRLAEECVVSPRNFTPQCPKCRDSRPQCVPASIARIHILAVPPAGPRRSLRRCQSIP